MAWFRKLTYAQKKEWKINHAKMNEADNARAINHPDLRKKSWSATHDAYYKKESNRNGKEKMETET
jgi:hypothetical protein